MKSNKKIILGGFVIFAVGLLTYYPASRIGLLNNDWYYLGQVARYNLPDYLVQYFDPRLQTGWYRPIFGILYLVVYTFFGPDPVAHHMAHILLHAATATLFYGLVRRVSQNTLISLVAGLVYVGLAVYSKAVYWPSVPDPLSMFFYLLAVWFWLDYLQSEKRRYAVTTLILFILSVTTKESSVTLPVVLFLVDRLIVCRKASLSDLARRYAPYALVLPVYLLIEYSIQHNGSYVSMANYGFGVHVFSNLINGLAWVASPWDLGTPVKYVWLGIVGITFLITLVIKRSRGLAFLGIFAALNLLPMLGFPPEWFETRYLYTPTMVSAILIGYLVMRGQTLANRQRGYGVLVSVALVGILFANDFGVSDAVTSWGEIARQRRIAFREISKGHTSYPSDTYLYFVDSPTVPAADLSNMFLLQYGKGITVEGTGENQIAHLREHAASFIYYFDNTGQRIEIPVHSTDLVHSAPSLPVNYQIPVRLEGFELAPNRVKQDEAFILLLYWRALGKIEKDYTVFVHMVDEQGHMVAGYDSQPKQGSAPTSQWVTGNLVVDAHVLPLEGQAPLGKYHLEIGLYDLGTQEQVAIMNDQGTPILVPVILEPLQVTN